MNRRSFPHIKQHGEVGLVRICVSMETENAAKRSAGKLHFWPYFFKGSGKTSFAREKLPRRDIIQYRCGLCNRIDRVRLFRRNRDSTA